MKIKTLKKPLNQLLKILIYVGFIFFVIYFFIRYSRELPADQVWPSQRSLIGSLIFTAGGFFWLALAQYWLTIYYTAQKHPLVEVLYQYFSSSLTRYTPGNVWSFVVRYQRFKKFGLTKQQNLSGMWLEAALIMFTSLIIGLPLLGQITDKRFTVMGIGLLIITIIGSWYSLAKVKPDSNFPWFRLVLSYLLVWVCWGMGWWFIVGGSWPNAIMVFALAWLVGYVSLLTPSGLGVRELMLVFFSVPLVGVLAATSFAIWSRLIYALAEVLLWTLLFWRHKSGAKST